MLQVILATTQNVIVLHLVSSIVAMVFSATPTITGPQILHRRLIGAIIVALRGWSIRVKAAGRTGEMACSVPGQVGQEHTWARGQTRTFTDLKLLPTQTTPTKRAA